MNDSPVALITGGARRIGACTARTLHAAGFRIIVHYRQSAEEALALVSELNTLRDSSAAALASPLDSVAAINAFAEQALAQWQRIDALINNASSFYPTPMGEITERDWDDLLGSNLKVPLFLSQALLSALKASKGCVVNIADIHADRPLKDHPVYCAAKAGNVMLTKSMAKDLAPEVRVNGVAPGAILWPEQESELGDEQKAMILERVPMNRAGEPDDIARTILFLLRDAPYINGQILAVDGGRSLAS